MESLLLLAHGVANAMSPTLLVAVLIGVVVGLMVGALPGLGPAAGVAIMLPVAVGFEGTASIAALAGIYYGAMFGGAVTAILLGIPGDAPAVMTVLDGHKLTKRGEGSRALGIAVCSSFVGGLVGVILLALLSVPIASFAVAFGPPEMTALMVLALSLVSVLGGRNMTKGFVSLFIGMWIGMIGLDPIGGPTRFTWGSMHLFDGIDFTVVAVGLFGLSEMFMSFSTQLQAKREKTSLRDLVPRMADVIKCRLTLIYGAIIGFVVGVLPGVGATASTMMSYGAAKRLSRDGDKFGEGEIEGVAAPEVANNAASYAAMIPLFALGIPGSATTAVLLGGLLMIGLQPGPMLFENEPDFVWTVFGTFWTGNLMLVILTILLIPVLSTIVFVSRALLYPCVIGIVIFGVYSINFSMFEVTLAVVAGAVGFLMLKLDYAPVPLILGLVLGPLLERGVRRSLVMSEGDPMIFLEGTLVTTLFVITALVIVLPLLKPGLQAVQKRLESSEV